VGHDQAVSLKKLGMPFWGLGLFVLEMIYGIHFEPAAPVIGKLFAVLALDCIHKASYFNLMAAL